MDTHRCSPRLKEYDYSMEGTYFLTIVTQNRKFLFGNIVDGLMHLNEAGMMVGNWWTELPHKFPTTQIDEFIVMPNHFHGIIFIMGPYSFGTDVRVRGGVDVEADVGADLCVRPNRPLDNAELTEHKGEGGHTGPPLPRLVQWFKTMTTNEYLRGVKKYGWIPFPGKLWQRSFYDHVIRDEDSLNRIREYIVKNPMLWEIDRDNPFQKGEDKFYRWLDSFTNRPGK